MNEYECKDCGQISREDELSVTGPIKDFDEDGQPRKRWAYLCPNEKCFSHKLQVLIKIRVRV